MHGGVTTICFAATCAAAFVLAVMYLFQHRNIWRAMALAVLTVGVVIQTISLCDLFFLQNDHFIGNAADWFAVLAWGFALSALWLSITLPKTLYMLFLLPVSVASAIVGVCLADTQLPVSMAAQTLRTVHTAALLGSSLFLFLGLTTGIMYIMQQRRLRRPLQRRLFPLPSLERLSRMLSRSAILAAGLLGIGIFTGYSMNHLYTTGNDAVPMTDLLVIGATFLFILLSVALVIARTNQNLFVKRVAVWMIICALILAILLMAGLWDRNTHWYHPSAVPMEGSVQ